MADDFDWLDDIILVAEGETEATAGAVDIFRSEGEACRYLEHWWVEDKLGFAFSAAGQRLNLGVDRTAVTVLSRTRCEDGKGIVLRWLQDAAIAIADTRKFKAAKRRTILSSFEERGDLPRSVEGLIAYIGFTE